MLKHNFKLSGDKQSVHGTINLYWVLSSITPTPTRTEVRCVRSDKSRAMTFT